MSHGHKSSDSSVRNKDFCFFFCVQRTTSSNVLIILDVADSAVVEGTDGPEETNDHQKAQGQRDSNDRPGVHFDAVCVCVSM